MAVDRRSALALATLRIAAGGFLLPHGLGKLFGWFGGPGLAGFVAELAHFGLPASLPLAVFAASVQTLAGLALALGWWTRLAALAAAGFLAVTVALNLGNGWYWMRGGIEFPLLWLIACLVFAAAGGGRYALDARRAGVTA